MYLDFDKLKELSKTLKEAHEADLDPDSERYAYSIEFAIARDSVRVHISWPFFRNLMKLEDAHLKEVTLLQDSVLHFTGECQGVTVVACMLMSDMKAEFEKLGLPDKDHPINFDDSLDNLFNLWQNLTGWCLPEPKEAE